MKSQNLININVSPEELISSIAIQTHIETVLRFDRNIHAKYHDKSGDTIGCGCIYCVTLHRYSNIKKLIHRVKNRILDDNYIYPKKELEDLDKNYLKTLKNICKKVKAEKDNLKKQLNL